MSKSEELFNVVDIGGRAGCSASCDPRLPTFKWVYVTPGIAKDYLAKNVSNRPINQADLRRIEKALLSGDYLVTHQGIAFDWDDNLIDGQHRLIAIQNTGVSVWMVVAEGLDPRVFHVLDIGKTRNGGDIFAIMAQMNGGSLPPNITRLVSTAKACLKYSRAVAAPSHFQSAQYACEHTALLLKYARVGEVRGATANITAAFVLADQAGWLGVEDASDRFRTMTGFSKTDPMRLLRERCDKGNFKGESDSLSRERHLLAVAALRAIHEGRGLNLLKASKNLVGDC